jgi:sporulation protein YlmC with PRC-barrel domain
VAVARDGRVAPLPFLSLEVSAMNASRWSLLLAGLLPLALVMQSRAEDPIPDRPVTDRPADGPALEDGAIIDGQSHPSVMSYRASELIGMTVYNTADEELGQIEDLVMDVDGGRVRYAALSFGGFLGIGDKLFAVPMHSLKFRRVDDEPRFVLNLNKERLENAPGFDKDAWPDFANPTWGAEVDAYYGSGAADTEADTHSGHVVSVTGDELTMTDESGEGRHSHQVGPNVSITIDGREARLSDLKKGQMIKVTTADENGVNVVVSIDVVRKTKRN